MGEKVARSCRKILHNLERYHQAWVGKLELPTNLEDPRIRHATRIALEHQLAETEILILLDLILNCSLQFAGYAGIHAVPSVNNHTPTREQLHIWRLSLPDLSEEEKNTLRENFDSIQMLIHGLLLEIRIASKCQKRLLMGWLAPQCQFSARANHSPVPVEKRA